MVKPMAAPKKTGLRERKKHLTRETIADAALALAVERGLVNVTLDDIATLAFVSARTVSNYFSCKEEAVVAAGTQNLIELPDRLAERPQGEPPLESLRQVVVDFVGSWSPEQARLERQKFELAQEHPALHPFHVARYDELEGAIRGVIAKRTHTNVDTDMYPWMAAAVAVSAFTSSIRLWAQDGSDTLELPELVRTAFDDVSGGLLPRAISNDREPPEQP
jgi:AcrR family transcriptional regulator